MEDQQAEVANQNPEITEEELRQRLGALQLVDVSSGVRSEAVDRADEYINEQTTEGGIRGWAKRIWHGNIARDYIRQREIRRNTEGITESGNLYLAAGGSNEEHNNAMQAVVNRFVDERIEHRQDESNSILDSIEGGPELQERLMSIISDFANGSIDAEALQEERTHALQTFGATLNAKDRNSGLMFADNILEVAQNARAAFEHGVGMDRIEAALTMRAGDARMGANTQAKLDAASRVLEKVQSTKAGSLINETTLSVAVGVATSVGKWTARTGGAALGRTLGMGVGAGVIAGFRERLRVDQERQLHARQMAEGGNTEVEGKRRQQLEEARYQTIAASEVLEGIENLQDRFSQSGEADPETVNDALNFIANIRTRLAMSDDRSIDLISYSSKTTLEQERGDLLLELAVFTAEMEEITGEMSDEDKATLGITGADFDENLQARENAVADIIEQDVTQKDSIYRSLRRNRALKMAAAGAAIGVSVGTLVQEVKAGFSDDLVGMLENSNSSNNRTMIADLINGDYSPEPTESLELNTFALEGESKVRLPEGLQLGQDPNGNYGIADDNGEFIAEGISFNPDGTLADEARQSLENNGFTLSQSTETYVTSQVTTEEVNLTAAEYINTHGDQFDSVNRELWYDNNTPEPNFDHNELRMHWGGEEGSGIDANGNYVINVSNMLEDGSFHGSESANFQELVQNGQMKIAISLSRETQDLAHFIDIDSNGNAIIPKDSAIGQSVFNELDGQANFIGGYAEAVQITGEQSDGTVNMRMLATVVGENNPGNISDTIETVVETPAERIITEITPPEIEPEVEVPPVVPIVPRKGLEKLPPAQREPGYYYQGHEGSDPREYDYSPRLLEDPEAKLETGQETDYYSNLLVERRGEEYVNGINTQIESDPVLSSLDSSTKAIVTIPVAAKGESGNIYNTLSLYAQQDKEALAQTAVLLHVNWIDDHMQDDSSRAEVEKTKSEIARAQADFPELKIATVETEWEREFIDKEEGGKRKGDVIGEVARKVFDTALLATDNAVKNGRRASKDEILVIRNDSDAQGIDSGYLTRMIRNFERHPDADAFIGRIFWESDIHGDYPGFALASNFREVMHAVTGRSTTSAHLPTIGINTAVRGSILAAMGSLGFGDYIGAGSDDLEIGGRIYHARSRQRVTENNKYSRRSSILKRRRYNYADSSGNDQADIIGKPIRHVAGAAIDTAADRVLNTYRDGKPITQSWSNFSGRSREEAGEDPKFDSESTRKEMDDIVRRVEQNITSMGRQWFRDPSYLSVGLGYIFGASGKDKQGNDLYELTWNSLGPKFRLTGAGETWLKNCFERNKLGQYDPLGRRTRRSLYNEADENASIQPRNPEPRFVAPAG